MDTTQGTISSTGERSCRKSSWLQFELSNTGCNCMLISSPKATTVVAFPFPSIRSYLDGIYDDISIWQRELPLHVKPYDQAVSVSQGKTRLWSVHFGNRSLQWAVHQIPNKQLILWLTCPRIILFNKVAWCRKRIRKKDLKLYTPRGIASESGREFSKKMLMLYLVLYHGIDDLILSCSAYTSRCILLPRTTQQAVHDHNCTHVSALESPRLCTNHLIFLNLWQELGPILTRWI